MKSPRIQIYSVAIALAWSSLLNPLVRGQCDYEITAILEGPEVCGIFGQPFVGGTAINDAGHVVGAFSCPQTGTPNAFAWYGEGLITPMPMPTGTFESAALAINEAGQIAGYVVIPSSGVARFAFFYDGGELTLIDPLPGANFIQATALNDHAQVVGYSFNSGVGGPPSQTILWQAGVLVNLGPVINPTFSRAAAINDAGQIAGTQLRTSFGVDALAFVYNLDSGELIDLGPIPGGFTSEAEAINDRGVVAGQGRIPYPNAPFGVRRAFVWSEGRMTRLEMLDEVRESFAGDINDAGQVVGYMDLVNGGNRAFLWQNGVLTDLNELVVRPPGDALDIATGINEHGQIVATLGAVSAVLSPVRRPPADLTSDCHVGFQDLSILLNDWGEGDSPADFDRNGAVGFFDLWFLLTQWGG